MTGVVAMAPPPDFGSGPGARSRIRAYRLSQVRRVLADAEAPLRFEDVHARLAEVDGVGIPMRTLKEPPLADLISVQTPRKGRLGDLAGLPWLLRRLDPVRLEARKVELEGRLRAMRLDLPMPLVGDVAVVGRRARIEYVLALETAVMADAAEHAGAIAERMVAALLERRDAVVARRAAMLSAAYRELRPSSSSGRTD